MISEENHEKRVWKSFLNRDIIWRNTTCHAVSNCKHLSNILLWWADLVTSWCPVLHHDGDMDLESVTCHTLWRLAVTRVTSVTVKSQIIIRHRIILAEQQWWSQISNMQWTLNIWSVRGLHITADSTSKLGFVGEPENQKTLLEWGPIDPSSVKMDPDSHETRVTAVMTREHVNIPGIMPDEVWWYAGSGGHWGLHPALGSRATITGHKPGG